MSLCKLLSCYWQILNIDPGKLEHPEIQYDSVNQTRAINKRKTVQGLKKKAQPAEKVNHHRNILPDRLLFTDTSLNML